MSKNFKNLVIYKQSKKKRNVILQKNKIHAQKAKTKYILNQK